MFKERRFLVGLGTGMIAGALLLQLMITGQQAPKDLMNAEHTYTEQEVESLIEKAKEEALSGNEAKASGADAAKAEGTEEERVEGAVKESAEETPPAKPSAPDKPAEPSESSVSSDANAPAEPNEPNEPVAQQVEQPAVQGEAVDPAPVVIRIEPGMNLTKTAKLLADNGIITSQSQFISKMKKDKKLVRAGFFAFSGQPTLDQTIDTLTGQPLTEAEASRIKSNS